MANERLIDLVRGALIDVAQRDQTALPDGLDAQTPLFGEQGLLDSLGLVTLVLTVEEAIHDQYGINLTLSDERAMSARRSPFRTIASLADYADSLIAQARG